MIPDDPQIQGHGSPTASQRDYIRVSRYSVNAKTQADPYPALRDQDFTGPIAWHLVCNGGKRMSLESVLADLELFLVGLIMAGTVCCDGPQFEDPTENFDLWSKSWDVAVPLWSSATKEQGWRAVGMSWEYHNEGW